jgi:hypothetical protein
VAPFSDSVDEVESHGGPTAESDNVDWLARPPGVLQMVVGRVHAVTPTCAKTAPNHAPKEPETSADAGDIELLVFPFV